jgi:ADP-heptose:LPS heptosyltransferase
MGLEAFRPLIEAIDAEWVSLQYKDPQAEIAATGLPVRHWPHGATTSDYDDTAALVSELDMVIGVHTAVHHLAGALGVPALVLVPSKGLWIWATPGATPGQMPWYHAARLFKQRDGEPWENTVARLSSEEISTRAIQGICAARQGQRMLAVDRVPTKQWIRKVSASEQDASCTPCVV